MGARSLGGRLCEALVGAVSSARAMKSDGVAQEDVADNRPAPAKKAPAEKAPAKKAPAKKAPAGESAPQRVTSTTGNKVPKRAKVSTVPDRSVAHQNDKKRLPMNAKSQVASDQSRPLNDPSGAIPVGPGESDWTDAEIAGVREELLDEVTELTQEIAEMESELADLLSEGVDNAGDDSADSGSKTFERDHEMSLIGTLEETRNQVTRALTRLDDGSYGFCTSCGEPIGKLRLQAFPRADLCLSCKQREDRR